MKKFLVLLFTSCFLLLSGLKAQTLEAEKPLIIGSRLEIKSEVLGENRILNIYLPPSYTPDSSNTYPVIYLLDGSMDEDFIHITGLVQFCSFSWINILPETIVVGIANIDRKRDFTSPSSSKIDQKEFPQAGYSEKFIQFIEKELQPFIERKYGTGSDRMLIGQSLGGLLATEILFKNPDLFNRYVIVSPSLWWDNETLLSVHLDEANFKPSIYIAGGKEGKVMERLAKELYGTFKNYTYRQDRIYFDYQESKSHGDILHQSVYNAFETFSKEEKKQPK